MQVVKKKEKSFMPQGDCLCALITFISACVMQLSNHSSFWVTSINFLAAGSLNFFMALTSGPLGKATQSIPLKGNCLDLVSQYWGGAPTVPASNSCHSVQAGNQFLIAAKLEPHTAISSQCHPELCNKTNLEHLFIFTEQ